MFHDGEAAAIDPREARAYATGVRGVPVGRPLVDSVRTALAGVAAGVTRINSGRKSADLKTAADGYVVAPNNVSIDAYGLVDVSVEPVMISVLALPSAR